MQITYAVRKEALLDKRVMLVRLFDDNSCSVCDLHPYSNWTIRNGRFSRSSYP